MSPVPRNLDELGKQVPPHLPITGKHSASFRLVRLQQASEPPEAVRDVVELACLIRCFEYAAVLLELKSDITLDERGTDVRAEYIDDAACSRHSGRFDRFRRVLSIANDRQCYS